MSADGAELVGAEVLGRAAAAVQAIRVVETVEGVGFVKEDEP